jgi:hypothetical protein
MVGIGSPTGREAAPEPPYPMTRPCSSDPDCAAAAPAPQPVPIVLDQPVDQAGQERVDETRRGDSGRDQQPHAVADVVASGEGGVDVGMGKRVVHQPVQACGSGRSRRARC